MDFQTLADYCQALALTNKLHPTEESAWRKFCRDYSKLFSTPLHVVQQMDPADVITELYENQLDDIEVDDNMEQIFDMIYSLEDPEYAKTKRDEFKDFVREAEEEEERRQASGKPIHKALKDEVSIKKTLPESTQELLKNVPQSGGINLSYLEREETGEE